MKAGDHPDVEAAELRSLLARRHVHAGHFGQVIVAGGAGPLSPHGADGHDLKGAQEQYESPDEWSSDHVRSSENDLIRAHALSALARIKECSNAGGFDSTELNDE
jgi:hypothetical protein